MKPKVLFVYDLENEHLWKDGLFGALELLNQDFEIWKENLQIQHSMIVEGGWDFVLGWGGFGSLVDKELQKPVYGQNKKGLCLGGYAEPHYGNIEAYDVIFHETEWSKTWLNQRGTAKKLVHAFGVNTNIYLDKPSLVCSQEKIWDYITVGAFALWKRQSLITKKEGMKLAIGQIQKGNLSESINIIGDLLLGGCAVSDMVPPEELAKLYRASKTCYIPSDVMGGGERAVLEARACGVAVEVEPDNPKLQELLTGPIFDYHYYAKQLKEGILSCVS